MSDLLIYIVISTILLIAFGGIFYVLPSKREREIGKLRLEARKSGMQVRSVVVPDVNAPYVARISPGGKRLEPKRTCVSWEKLYDIEVQDAPVWRLFTTHPDEHDHEGNQMDPPLDDAELQNAETYWAEVENIKSLAPKSLVGLECTSYGVGWIGREKPMDTLDVFIKKMSETLDRLIHLNVQFAQNRQQANEPNKE